MVNDNTSTNNTHTQQSQPALTAASMQNQPFTYSATLTEAKASHVTDRTAATD